MGSRSSTLQCPNQGEREKVKVGGERERAEQEKKGPNLNHDGEGGRGGGDWPVRAAWCG